MAPPDSKPQEAKAPAKLQIINLKVFIHCEGCKKKVKKILRQIDGVETVVIDAEQGKVTVTGTVDSQVLIKKLEKAGKVAEVLASSNAKGKELQKVDQPKGEKKEVKKVRFEEDVGRDKKGKGGGNGNAAVEAGKRGDNSGISNKGSTGHGDGEESGRKKRVGEGAVDDAGPSKSTVHKNITLRMIETGYSVESADYATHIFSDENTESCHIM